MKNNILLTNEDNQVQFVNIPLDTLNDDFSEHMMEDDTKMFIPKNVSPEVTTQFKALVEAQGIKWPVVTIEKYEPNSVSEDNGVREWKTKDGVLHRIDGPARIVSGKEEFWVFGVQYSQEEYQELAFKAPTTGTFKVRSMIDYEMKTYDVRSDYPWVYVDFKGYLHRLDGSGYVTSTKYESYAIHGLYHREGAPARTWNRTGSDDEWKEEWIQNGVYHRTDGPARVHKDDPWKHQYWIRGERVSYIPLKAFAFKNFNEDDADASLDIHLGLNNSMYHALLDNPPTLDQVKRGMWAFNEQGFLERTGVQAVLPPDSVEVTEEGTLLPGAIVGKKQKLIHSYAQSFPTVDATTRELSFHSHDPYDSDKKLLHRIDGPAWVRDGEERFFVHGIEYSEAEFEELAFSIPVGARYEYTDIAGNSHADCRSTGHREIWIDSKGFLHSVEGQPAKSYGEHHDWWCHGLLHREDGPASIGPNGEMKYILHGQGYENLEDYLKALEGGKVSPEGKKESRLKKIGKVVGSVLVDAVSMGSHEVEDEWVDQSTYSREIVVCAEDEEVFHTEHEEVVMQLA